MNIIKTFLALFCNKKTKYVDLDKDEKSRQLILNYELAFGFR